MYLDKETFAIGLPQELVRKYQKDFEKLPHSGRRDEILTLRASICRVTEMLWTHPELAQNVEYVKDLQRVLVMREAMRSLGIFYDA